MNMKFQKNTNLFTIGKVNHNKKSHIIRCLISNHSSCHRVNGDFDDKENIN